jgi:hypothetical protein
MNAQVEIEKPKSFQGEVWSTLSRIDCSKHVEKKQNLSYLSWAWAWAILMENYPESIFEFDEPKEYPDGTHELWVTVTVADGERSATRRMWLPVLDHRNAPIKNPNAFQVNTTRMRCLTKALAMFGLGHYIYAGEDLPRPENDAPPVGEKKDNSVAGAVLVGEKFDEDLRREYVHALTVAVAKEDIAGLAQYVEELKTDAILKVAVWHQLDSKTRAYIKKFENEQRAAA